MEELLNSLNSIILPRGMLFSASHLTEVIIRIEI